MHVSERVFFSRNGLITLHQFSPLCYFLMLYWLTSNLEGYRAELHMVIKHLKSIFLFMSSTWIIVLM